MKYYSIVSFMLIIASAKAQETPVKRNEYKSFGFTFSSYSKPQASSLYGSTLLLNPSTYDDVRRNSGMTVQYSQMNFIKNFGIEFGIGVELMQINHRFNFTLPTSSGQDVDVQLKGRSSVVNVILPLHYVHRIELGKGFTLFPKIGLDTKILIHSPNVGGGSYTDSSNNLNYLTGYETSHKYSRFPLENVFFNGTIGASLTWSTKSGALFGIQFTFSMQLFSNTLLTRINNIKYKRDSEIVFDSNRVYGDYYYHDPNGNLVYKPLSKMNDYLAENKMTNFSIGLSYTLPGK